MSLTLSVNGPVVKVLLYPRQIRAAVAGAGPTSFLRAEAASRADRAKCTVHPPGGATRARSRAVPGPRGECSVLLYYTASGILSVVLYCTVSKGI